LALRALGRRRCERNREHQLLALIAPLLIALIAAALTAPPPARADVPLPWTFTVHNAPCPDGGGDCAYAATAQIYVEDGDPFALWHEIGHVFDAQRLSDRDRGWFERKLRLTGPWTSGTGLDGLRSPSEWFADAYAACALGLSPDHGVWVVAYGYDPPARRHRAICRAIRRVGRPG
jgi:hypothetical protein